MRADAEGIGYLDIFHATVQKLWKAHGADWSLAYVQAPPPRQCVISLPHTFHACLTAAKDGNSIIHVAGLGHPLCRQPGCNVVGVLLRMFGLQHRTALLRGC